MLIHGLQKSANVGQENQYHLRYKTKGIVYQSIEEFRKCVEIYIECFDWKKSDKNSDCHIFYDLRLFEKIMYLEDMGNLTTIQCWKYINIFTPNMDDFANAN